MAGARFSLSQRCSPVECELNYGLGCFRNLAQSLSVLPGTGEAAPDTGVSSYSLPHPSSRGNLGNSKGRLLEVPEMLLQFEERALIGSDNLAGSRAI